MGKYVAMVFCIIQMVLVPFMAGCSKSDEPGTGPLKEAIIIDHNHTDLGAIPDAWISGARQECILLTGIPPTAARLRME